MTGSCKTQFEETLPNPTERFRPLCDLPHSDVHHFKANALRSPDSPWNASLVKKKKSSTASHNALPGEWHRKRADASREHAQHWALTAHDGVALFLTASLQQPPLQAYSSLKRLNLPYLRCGLKLPIPFLLFHF